MTEHKARIESIRNRMNHVLPKIPKDGRRRGGQSEFSVFADRMAVVAKNSNMWVWDVKNLSHGGAPKDLASSLKQISLGNRGCTSKLLDLIELTCIEFERDFRDRHRISVAQAAGIPLEHVGGLSESALASLPESQRHEETVVKEPPFADPEILALYAVKDALDKCAPDEQARVIKWACDKYGVTLG